MTAYYSLGNTSNPTNTWVLPPNSGSRDKLRKHYIPKDTPDGDYLVKLLASGAGDNGDLTTTITVRLIAICMRMWPRS